MEKTLLRILIVVLLIGIGWVCMLRWAPEKPMVDQPAEKYKEMMAAQHEPLPSSSLTNSKPAAEGGSTTQPSERTN